jgi:toxin-antitoxin system PIN domain toxin
VKVPDLNLLIYAVDRQSPHHPSALRWWNGLLSGNETVGLSWTVLLGFVRLTTNPRVVRSALAADEALDYVDRWLAHRLTTVIDPTPRHAGLLRDLLTATGTAANLVADAHLAALAIEHGGTLYSADHDFGRFAGLSWIDPLTG